MGCHVTLFCFFDQLHAFWQGVIIRANDSDYDNKKKEY